MGESSYWGGGGGGRVVEAGMQAKCIKAPVPGIKATTWGGEKAGRQAGRKVQMVHPKVILQTGRQVVAGSGEWQQGM